MATTLGRSPSRARLASTAVAGAALLAASGVLTPALASSSTAAAASVTTSSHQRLQPAAHRIVHRDPRRDVLRFDVDAETSKPAPRNRATDIIRTVVDHRAHQVVVQARARQLSRSHYRLMVAQVLTSDGRRYELLVDYSTTPIGSRLSLERTGRGADVRCPGATWSLNRSDNRVRAAIPNRCLGRPGWVRVGVALVAAPLSLRTSLADDSRTRGHVRDRLTLGPRQPRA